ncbi:similar to RIKEN cDNA 2010305C02 (predicted), isoform CRA_c [Rattus norvegicus]|uniref:Uncharacterized protein n=1 Tax=Rattus norvegicus TaxID=10116 RepID=A6HGR0_RAT|nr:similar to RIKEN cDNA 2010305C02 (predicted), isoform CRA_c [Rattus norvegicus]
MGSGGTGSCLFYLAGGGVLAIYEKLKVLGDTRLSNPAPPLQSKMRDRMSKGL